MSQDKPWHNREQSIELTVPPLATIYLRLKRQDGSGASFPEHAEQVEAKGFALSGEKSSASAAVKTRKAVAEKTASKRNATKKTASQNTTKSKTTTTSKTTGKTSRKTAAAAKSTKAKAAPKTAARKRAAKTISEEAAVNA